MSRVEMDRWETKVGRLEGTLGLRYMVPLERLFGVVRLLATRWDGGSEIFGFMI
jgi:hypothetical protein